MALVATASLLRHEFLQNHDTRQEEGDLRKRENKIYLTTFWNEIHIPGGARPGWPRTWIIVVYKHVCWSRVCQAVFIIRPLATPQLKVLYIFHLTSRWNKYLGLNLHLNRRRKSNWNFIPFLLTDWSDIWYIPFVPMTIHLNIFNIIVNPRWSPSQNGGLHFFSTP